MTGKIKADNAIIMAAGMSTRFAPISYEKPKGLVKVKGEILIERQIEQLKAAGINDITIVLGYKKEQFFYLEDRYNVKFVINPDYYRYNNVSTLYMVRNLLKNTYICSADNYFVENVFEEYVDAAYYACVFHEGGTDEYCIKTNNDRFIESVTIGGQDSLIMLGHAFFDEQFSQQMKQLLEAEYAKPEVKNMLWEKLYIQHLDKFSMKAREYSPQLVWEFDSMDDVQAFDGEFLDSLEFD